jgi:thiosulfate/3-mercaptopyruvate sulfurtransferase
MTMHSTLVDAMTVAAMPPGSVLLVDCRVDLTDRTRSAHDYARAHLPGAIHADLDTDLSDLLSNVPHAGRHPLPSAAGFSAVLSRWGWTPGLQVVAYDAAGGALAAARLWWLLRVAGVREAAVLDGGLVAWASAGHPLESSPPRRDASEVRGEFDVDETVSADVLADEVARGTAVLLDARAAPRFRGDVEPLDPVAGHVPGARNRPYADNLAADGRFKPAVTLRSEFTALLGAHSPREVVHMCGSGVTACHNLLAMEYAGLTGSRLFAPSWSGWVSDPARPAAKGEF